MKELKEKIGKLGKKAIVIAVSFLILIIVIIFGGAFLYNKFFYKRSYTEIESIMLNAAQNHMRRHSGDLPDELNESVTLSVDDLVKEEEMKEISEYTKDSSLKCNGSVIVTNVNKSYRYTPILNCSDKYSTVKFIDYIKEKHPIVESGNGLYNLNEELVFRGDNVNNFLKLSGKMYRIVKFSSDEAVIIFTDKDEKVVWDTRYNVEKKGTYGINDYSVSQIRDYLNKVYKNVNYIDDAARRLIVSYDLYVGRRSSQDTDKSGQIEKSAVMENQFIGLLPIYDFMNASLDANCVTDVSPSCMNYNYLTSYRSSWWSVTGSKTKTYQVCAVIQQASYRYANKLAVARYVLHLAKDAMYVSGDGTFDNPYIVK